MTASINPTRDTVSELAQSAEFRAAIRDARLVEPTVTPFMAECFRLIDAIHRLIDAEHARPHELMEAWRVVEVRAEWLGKAVWKLPVEQDDKEDQGDALA
jgi:hypothetical protein